MGRSKNGQWMIVASSVTQMARELERVQAEKDELEREIASIRSAVTGAVGGGRRGRGRPRGTRRTTTAIAPVKQTRKKITDPEVLAKRREALARARLVRSQKRTAAEPKADREPQPVS